MKNLLKRFGILGAATLAILGVLHLRGSSPGSPSEPSVIRAVPATSAPVLPAFPSFGTESSAPESREAQAQPQNTAPAAVGGPTPAIEPGAPQAPDDKNPHPGDRAKPERILALHGDKPLTEDHPDVAAAIKIQERHPELLRRPGVVGTAVGLNDAAEVAIIVYTKTAPAVEIPAALEGIPVAVWVSGEFRALRGDQDKIDALAKPSGGGTTTDPFDPTLKDARPVHIGVSTGHPAITAGTIGCRLKIGTAVFALSNNHVYANENNASTGDSVLQPGTFDGGVSPGDAIGTLFDFEPLKFYNPNVLPLPDPLPLNKIDSAIALSDTANLGRATPDTGYGTPSSTTASPAIRMSVKKYGRTTKLTTGKIQAISGRANVGYEVNQAGYFEDQLIIGGGSFSAGGDSGSLIVTATGNHPVGLLFAGGGGSTVANKISNVLSRFGATVDGQ